MRFEVPQCRRCCLCLPLRYGIIVFGYLNLGFSLLIFSLMLWMSFGQRADKNSFALYHGVEIYTQIWIELVLYGLEVVFHVVLLIGAHMKKSKVIKVYYYYGLATTVACFVSFITILIDFHGVGYWKMTITEGALAFCGIVLQIYLLLLIRSELEKLRTNGGFRFVNHEGEFVVHLPGIEEGDGRNPL